MIKVELFEILIAIYTGSLMIHTVFWIQKRSHLKQLINIGKSLLAGVHNELHIIKYIDGTVQIAGKLNENLPNTMNLNNEYETWISEVSKYCYNIKGLFYDPIILPLTMYDNIIELQKKYEIETILTCISKGIPILETTSKKLHIYTILSDVLNTFPSILKHIGIPINQLAKLINIISISILIYGVCEKFIFPMITNII